MGGTGDKHGEFGMRSTASHIESDPHDAPIAPDIVPQDWADCVPKPANDVSSREKLFAEIRRAAETAAPKVDTTFRASDVNAALKGSGKSRWVKRALTVFVFALLSAFATAAWRQHGDSALQIIAGWLPSANSSPAPEPAAELAVEPAAEQKETAASLTPEPAPVAQALPSETLQQIQSMAQDLAAMGQQIEQLKATIETLKANQQAAIAPTPPAAPAHRAPAPPRPRATVLRPRTAPVTGTGPANPVYPPMAQAAAVPPPAPAMAPAPTTQPNGEPILRPPMPMPLQDRY